MRKTSLLFLSIAFAFLFVSCSDAMNSLEETAPSYEIMELASGATYAEFQLATETEHSSLVDYTVALKDASVSGPADQKSFVLNHKSRTVEFSDLKPDTEYILEVTYNFASGIKQTLNKSFDFSTKPVYVPEFYFEYDSLQNCVIIKAEKENLSNMCNRLTILRSTEIDGTYIEVGNDYLNNRTIDFVDNKNIEPKTTYFYKFQLYDAKNLLLVESEEPVLFNASKAVPESVSKKSLKARTGLTSVSFTWEPVDFADYYEVEVSEDEDFEKVLEGCLKLEECSYTVKELLPEQKIYFRVFAVNDIGKSKEASVIEAEIQEPKITDVSVLTGQSQVQYFVSTSFDNLEDYCSVVYTLRKSAKPDSAKIISADFTEPVLTRSGLIPETLYSSNSLGDYIAGYVHMTISYKQEDGSVKTYTSYRKVNDFYTDGYDAVTNLQVASIRSTDAVLSFTELTDAQKYGQTVNYAVYAYSNGAKDAVYAEADSSPVKVSGLEPGRYYNFKLVATAIPLSTDPLYKQFFAETEAATESGLNKPEGLVVTESLVAKDAAGKDLLPYQTALNVKWNKLPEAMAGQQIAYGVEYKVLEKSNFVLAAKDIKEDNIVFAVNGGNKYKVRVFAYNVTDPDCVSYSEVSEVQTKVVDDAKLAADGKLICLTDSKFWGEAGEPHSSLKNGYVLQFLSAEEGQCFKYSFDMNAVEGSGAAVSPRLIFVDRTKITPVSENYGVIEEVAVTTPVAGNIVAAFANLNMPKFAARNDCLKSVDQMETAGVQVRDEWLFNNSVYLSVKQKEAGDVGFSYFY